MNILISSSSFLLTDSHGIGEGIACYEITKRLIQRGHNVYIISNDSRLKDEKVKSKVIDLGITLYPMISELREEVGWHYFSYRALELAKEIVKREGIDVIHHMLPSYKGRYSLLPLLKKPFVYGPISTEHKNIDFKTEFVGNYIPLSDCESALANKLEVVSKEIYDETLKRADKIIITLEPVRGELPEEVRAKTVTIPLGVDGNTFIPAEEENKNLILSVGAMTKIKGFDYLISAMSLVVKEMPNARLVFVGDGPDLKYFQSFTQKNKLQNNIKFLGEIPHEEINTIFQECSLYCQPSLSESFGIARLEAMASGKPVVYSTSGAGEGGFVSNPGLGGGVSPRDPDALASEILRFLKSDELRHSAGLENRKLVEKFYDWEIITDRYEQLYKSLV